MGTFGGLRLDVTTTLVGKTGSSGPSCLTIRLSGGEVFYNDLLDFQQIFLSEKETRKGREKNQDRDGHAGVCGEKHVSLPESAK